MELQPNLYRSEVDQLELFMKYGPLGIKVDDNQQFVRSSLIERLHAYLFASLSIFTRQSHQHTEKVIALLAQRIRKIPKKLSDVNDQPFLEHICDVVNLWNKYWGQSTGLGGGSFQSWLLNVSGIKRKALEAAALNVHDFYIQLSITLSNVPDDLPFNCSFSNAQRLPLILTPKTDEIKSYEKLHEWLLNHRQIISNLIKNHGAIKFRGFQIEANQFEATVEAALDCKSQDYIGGDGSRDPVGIGQNVYTSTKAPEHYSIDFHQERSVNPDMPDFISFYCEKPPLPGTGQTTLAQAELVTQALQRTPIWNKYANQELTYISRHPPAGHFLTKIDPTHKTWQDLLGIDKEASYQQSRIEAEKISKERGFTYKWDGNWYVKSQNAPATRPNPHTGEQLWMNQIHFSKLTPQLVGNKLLYWLAKLIYILPRTWRSDVSFQNGKPVSTEDVSVIFDTLRSHTTVCDWLKRDLLLVDNKTIMHGRAPSDASKGKRLIYTIMSSRAA